MSSDSYQSLQSEQDIEPLLINGSTPAAAADVEQALHSLGVEFTTDTHPAMRTVADSRRYRSVVKGGYSKNLFLRNKKGRMWLVTLEESRRVDLKLLGRYIGAGRVSFASAQRLMHYLGVRPGAVTPFAVMNDRSRRVTAFIDQKLIFENPLHFHPCDNTKTTTLASDGLLSFMKHFEHEPDFIGPEFWSTSD